MTKTCIVCGKEFDAYRTQKTCSPECADIRKKQRYEEYRSRDNAAIDSVAYCKFCGKPFTPIRCTQYCCMSPECQKEKWRAQKHKKKNQISPSVTVYEPFKDPEHYASNQIAKTLANVPKIRVEL